MVTTLIPFGAVAASDSGGTGMEGNTETTAAVAADYPGASRITDFADESSIQHTAAVSMLVSLGILDGIVQSQTVVKYQPSGTLTRAQAAKILAAATTFKSGEAISGSASFSDTASHWAADDIAYCADLGIADGLSDGTFAPDTVVTGYELAKMLLSAMGVTGLTGSDWQTVVSADAAGYGLFSGITADLSAAVTRDDAAQMIYNAMTSAKNDGSGALPNVVSVSSGPSVDGTVVTPAQSSSNTTTFTMRDDSENYIFGLYYKDGTLSSDSSSLVLGGVAGSYAGGSIDGLNMVADNVSGFTSVVADASTVTVSDAYLVNEGYESDGKDASDFTGINSVLTAINGASLTLKDSDIVTSGPLRTAFIADNNSQITIQDSSITTTGANPLTDLYDGYLNSANQALMVSPPWVLGISGSSRTGNLLGDYCTLNVIGSTLTSGGWAVLSVDACTSPVINVVDSSLSILPESEGGMSSGNFSYSEDYGSGYGSYLIGGAQEYFYGATYTGTTYAAILTGGDAVYQSSNGTIDLKKASESGPVSSGSTVTGAGKVTTIHSVFGFMAHNSGSISVKDGTVVDTEDAAFLYKAGDVTFNADDASIHSGNGVILQMIDNDDSTVGAYESETFGMPTFNTTFSEAAGWPSENGSVTAAGSDTANSVVLNLTNGDYQGDVFNGTGYYNQTGDTLTVTLGAGATLTGDISLTETRHVDENGDQNTGFTSAEYYYLGHVENRVYNNGTAAVAVVLEDGAVWNPTFTGTISSLTVGKGCTINGTVTVNGVATTVEAGKTYTGEIVVAGQSIQITSLTYDTSATDSQAVATISSVSYRMGTETQTISVDQATQNATLTVDGVQYDLISSYEDGTRYAYTDNATTGITLTTKGDAQSGTGVNKFFHGVTQPESITYYFNAGAWVTSQGLLSDYSVLDVLDGGTTNSSGSTGTTIVSKGGFFNGYYISGATYDISGLNMTLVGNGGDDFQGWGAGIMATDGADVTVDKSVIDTTGTIRTAIWAGGDAANLKVTNTVVTAHNNDSATAYSDEDNYAVPMLERTPFVLGMNGDIRATNVLGSATANYSDSIVVSNVWGALSTDSGVEGTKALTASNVLAGIGTLEVAQTGKTYTATKEVNGVNYGFTIGKLGERSGYVTYADAGVYDVFNSVFFYAPDYIGIIASGSSAMYLNDSYGYSDRIGFMIHQNQGTTNPGTGEPGGLYINGGTYDVADTFVSIRGGLVASSYTTTNISVDGAEVNLFGTAAQSGVLLRLMQSDDAGNPGVTSCAIENATYDQYKSYDVTQTVDPTTATFSNMTVDGDIYNSVYKVYQALDVTLSNMTLTGVVSSGIQTHVDADGNPFAGTVDITGDGYLAFGRVATTVYPAVNNPVNLTVTDGTVWNVTGTSYLASLTFDSASTINGVVTVDGTVVTTPGTYTGSVVVTAK